MIELFSILIQILVVTVFCYFLKMCIPSSTKKKEIFSMFGNRSNLQYFYFAMFVIFLKQTNELLNFFLIIYFVFNLLFLVKDNFINFNKK